MRRRARAGRRAADWAMSWAPVTAMAAVSGTGLLGLVGASSGETWHEAPATPCWPLTRCTWCAAGYGCVSVAEEALDQPNHAVPGKAAVVNAALLEKVTPMKLR